MIKVIIASMIEPIKELASQVIMANGNSKWNINDKYNIESVKTFSERYIKKL